MSFKDTPISKQNESANFILFSIIYYLLSGSPQEIH